MFGWFKKKNPAPLPPAPIAAEPKQPDQQFTVKATIQSFSIYNNEGARMFVKLDASNVLVIQTPINMIEKFPVDSTVYLTVTKDEPTT